MNKKEVAENMGELLKPQDKAFRELMEEMDGKVMNYLTLRGLEDVYEAQKKMMIDVCVGLAEEVKKKKKESVARFEQHMERINLTEEDFRVYKEIFGEDKE